MEDNQRILIDVAGQSLALPGFVAVAAWDDPGDSFWALPPSSPFRPPDWRWRLGLWPRRARWAAGDPWMRRVRVAQRIALRSGTLLAPAIARRDPELAEAVRLRWGSDPWLRVEVEARVLAGQSDDEIATRCGSSPGAVSAFVAALWDTRQALSSPSWVLAQAVGIGALHRGRGAAEHALRLLAYRGGPLALDSALAALRCGTQDETAGAEARRARRLALATIVRMVLPDEAFTLAQRRAALRLEAEVEGTAARARTAAVCSPLAASAVTWLTETNSLATPNQLSTEPLAGDEPRSAPARVLRVG